MNLLESAEDVLQGIVLIGATAGILVADRQVGGNWSQGTVDWKPIVTELLGT